MIGMRVTIRGLGVISMLVLARLLAPADFGLVALATLVMGLVETASQFGFDNAIIQNQKANHEHYNSAWTLNIIRGLISGVALVAIAVPASGFFNEPRLAEIIYCLAIASALEGFQNIGIVEFRRNLTFGREYKFFVFIKLSSFFTTLIIALVFRSYWALVAGIVMRSVTMLVLSYSMHPYRPRFGLSKSRELFNFSKWLLVNEYLIYVARNIDRLLIGRFLNAGSLGIYSLAKEIATLLSAELVLPITRAMFPGYSKISDDPERLKEMFVSTIGLVFLFSWPLAFGIAAVAEPFVLVMLGEKWLPVAEILPYLAIGGALSFAWVNTGPLFLSVGKPQLATATFVIGFVIRTIVVVAGFYFEGLIGLAKATAIVPVIMFPIDYLFVRKVLDLSLQTYFFAVWRSISATLFMYIGITWLSGTMLTFSEPARLVVFVTIGAATFVGMQLILWWISGRPNGAEANLINIIKERYGRKFDKASQS